MPIRIAYDVHVLEADLTTADVDHVRRPGSRDMHGPSLDHQHALAALVLLNDPTYVEASRKLASGS